MEIKIWNGISHGSQIVVIFASRVLVSKLWVICDFFRKFLDEEILELTVGNFFMTFMGMR